MNQSPAKMAVSHDNLVDLVPGLPHVPQPNEPGPQVNPPTYYSHNALDHVEHPKEVTIQCGSRWFAYGEAPLREQLLLRKRSSNI